MKIGLKFFDGGGVLIENGIVADASYQFNDQIDDNLRIVKLTAGLGNELCV